MTDTPSGSDQPQTRRAARQVPQDQGTPAPTPDLNDLFAGRTSTDTLGTTPPRPDRRRRRRRAWTLLVIAVVVIGALVVGGVWAVNTFGPQVREALGWAEPTDWEEGLAHGEVLITIQEGDTGQAVSSTLADAGVTMTPSALYGYLLKASPNHAFQPGTYRLQLQMSAAAALAELDDPANRVEDTVLLREGLTVPQSLQAISDGLGLPLADLEAAVATPSDYGVEASTLEGWLFPATYTFEPGTTATDVIARLVERTVTSLDAAEVPVADRERILIIASIIQREARTSEDFLKVSRVIQNRLDIGMQLEMDSTAQFGFNELHDGTVSSSAEALDDVNAWNTYVIDGLPVGPIANPGDAAISAAMHPADGPWLFFVTVNLDTGETVFTETNAQHNAAVAQWRAWCRDNPGSGC